jgi:hypothetical protein
MIKYCDQIKEITLDILMDLHVFSSPDYEKAVFGMLSVCINRCALH